MSSITFVDYQTIIPASWLNDVNNMVYNGVVPATTLSPTNLAVSTNASIANITNNVVFTSTGAITLPSGTTGQEPGTPSAGMLRFNTTTTQFEGYNGSAWASVGGAAISNNTSTSTPQYPLFASATSGTALTIYTSNAKFLYKPSTGELQASEITANNGLILNSTTVSTSYTIASGYNAMSVGLVTVANGQTVTVSNGQRWVVM